MDALSFPLDEETLEAFHEQALGKANEKFEEDRFGKVELGEGDDSLKDKMMEGVEREHQVCFSGGAAPLLSPPPPLACGLPYPPSSSSWDSLASLSAPCTTAGLPGVKQVQEHTGLRTAGADVRGGAGGAPGHEAAKRT